MIDTTLTPFYRPPPSGKTIWPETIPHAADAIRSATSTGHNILIRGGGTKWSLGRLPPEDNAPSVILEMGKLQGVLEYDPGELTITAYAGTRLADVTATLAQHGQYLPFDPLFATEASPATLGGTVAAGLSGPRRLRYGGLRDFIIGIQYLNSAGTLIKAGGKVVKNAAGYDYPKLFCGSLGTLGLLTQVSFKVFPAPTATQTLLIGMESAAQVQVVFQAILQSKIEVSAADAWTANVSPGSGNEKNADEFRLAPYTAAVQVDGVRASLTPRVDALVRLLPAGIRTQPISNERETALWTSLRDLAWIRTSNTGSILRLSLPPDRLSSLDKLLQSRDAQVVYSLGGNAAWVVITDNPLDIASALGQLGVMGTIWYSPHAELPEIIPVLPGHTLVRRIKQAFDPAGIFYPGRYASP